MTNTLQEQCRCFVVIHIEKTNRCLNCGGIIK